MGYWTEGTEVEEKSNGVGHLRNGDPAPSKMDVLPNEANNFFVVSNASCVVILILSCSRRFGSDFFRTLGGAV
jgi:hypothetical protein